MGWGGSCRGGWGGVGWVMQGWGGVGCGGFAEKSCESCQL